MIRPARVWHGPTGTIASLRGTSSTLAVAQPGIAAA
jgi:hypothetical protein